MRSLRWCSPASGVTFTHTILMGLGFLGYLMSVSLLLAFLLPFQSCPARLPFPLAVPVGKFVPECDFHGEWSMRELSALLGWISSARAEDKPRGEGNCTQQYFVFKCQHQCRKNCLDVVNVVLNLYFEVKSI